MFPVVRSPCTHPRRCMSASVSAVCLATFLARSARSLRPVSDRTVYTLNPAGSYTRHECRPSGSAARKWSLGARARTVGTDEELVPMFRTEFIRSRGSRRSESSSKDKVEWCSGFLTLIATSFASWSSRASQVIEEPPEPSLCTTL